MYEITGAKELAARFLALRKSNAVTKAIQAGGKLVASDARRLAPRKTGALAASIKVVKTKNGCKVNCQVPYGRFQNYGTRFLLAKKFLDKAAKKNEKKIVQLCEKAIRSAIA